jgi:hypothetical protein
MVALNTSRYLPNIKRVCEYSAADEAKTIEVIGMRNHWSAIGIYRIVPGVVAVV